MSITRNIIILALASLIFTACGERTVAIDSSQSNTLRGKSVTYVKKQGPVRPYTQHSTISPTAGLGALSQTTKIAFQAADAAAGAASTSMSRNKSLQSNGKYYGKPTDMLSKQIMAYMVRKYHVRPKNNRFAPLGANQQPNYSAYKADYVLDVTSNWRTAYLTLLGHVVILKSDIKLVNSKNQKTVFQYSCMYESTIDKGLKKKIYSKDELYANNGKILKQVTSRAVSLCMEEIKLKALK
jgi:hypothetical protein